MKKYQLMLIFTLSPLALFSCAKPSIDMPKSPFDDSYIRIGMKGEFDITDTMPQKDYNEIKKCVTDGKDVGVTHYIRQEESRDLKYAYFGQESSTVSQCSMASINESGFRYPNMVTISSNVTDQQIQSANSGIIKTIASSADYFFNDTYPHNETTTYSQRKVKKNNDEAEVVTEPVKEKSYTDEQADSIFGLTPFTSRIKSHFLPSTIRDVKYEFKLLGDNNKAIYGMSGNKYLIKEGYSIFPDFKTTMGRTYKAEDNFFYEGLLEKYQEPGNEDTYVYRFTNFRFYHELLILSKAFDGTGVPILYLDKPVLIDFSEVRYEISYDALNNYTGSIPDVTTPTIE